MENRNTIKLLQEVRDFVDGVLQSKVLNEHFEYDLVSLRKATGDILGWYFKMTPAAYRLFLCRHCQRFAPGAEIYKDDDGQFTCDECAYSLTDFDRGIRLEDVI